MCMPWRQRQNVKLSCRSQLRWMMAFASRFVKVAERSVRVLSRRSSTSCGGWLVVVWLVDFNLVSVVWLFPCGAFRRFKGRLVCLDRVAVGQAEGCSSIGRALVSKTSGCGFKSLRPCHLKRCWLVGKVSINCGWLGCVECILG